MPSSIISYLPKSATPASTFFVGWGLIGLSNMENLNAVFIEQGMPQQERLIKLNQIAIHQMSVLESGDNDRKLLKRVTLTESGVMAAIAAIPAKATKKDNEGLNAEEALDLLNANGYPIKKGQLYKETSANTIPHKKFGNHSRSHKWSADHQRLHRGKDVRQSYNYVT